MADDNAFNDVGELDALLNEFASWERLLGTTLHGLLLHGLGRAYDLGYQRGEFEFRNE